MPITRKQFQEYLDQFTPDMEIWTFDNISMNFIPLLNPVERMDKGELYFNTWQDDKGIKYGEWEIDPAEIVEETREVIFI